MSQNSEIGHSSYMIGKTEARLKHQRLLQKSISDFFDRTALDQSKRIIVDLEISRVDLYKTHRAMTRDLI